MKLHPDGVLRFTLLGYVVTFRRIYLNTPPSLRCGCGCRLYLSRIARTIKLLNTERPFRKKVKPWTTWCYKEKSSRPGRLATALSTLAVDVYCLTSAHVSFAGHWGVCCKKLENEHKACQSLPTKRPTPGTFIFVFLKRETENGIESTQTELNLFFLSWAFVSFLRKYVCHGSFLSFLSFLFFNLHSVPLSFSFVCLRLPFPLIFSFGNDKNVFDIERVFQSHLVQGRWYKNACKANPDSCSANPKELLPFEIVSCCSYSLVFHSCCQKFCLKHRSVENRSKYAGK